MRVEMRNMHSDPRFNDTARSFVKSRRSRSIALPPLPGSCTTLQLHHETLGDTDLKSPRFEYGRSASIDGIE